MPTEFISQAKQVMLDMLIDVDKICRENNLTYFLAYGTCLGAVRHQGFIPWDDDIDIGMPRESFEKFCHLIDEKYKDRYDITSPILAKEKQYLPFAKIYKKNTLYIEEACSKTPFPQGVFIDVFPFDYLPDIRWKRSVLLNIFTLIENIILSSRLEWFRSAETISYMKKNQKAKYYTSTLLASLLTIFLPFSVLRKLQTKLAIMSRSYNYISCYFNDKPYKTEDILPVSQASFEGHLFSVPHHVHNYLTVCFDKNYMQLPPVEKRRIHHIVKIKV